MKLHVVVEIWHISSICLEWSCLRILVLKLELVSLLVFLASQQIGRASLRNFEWVVHLVGLTFAFMDLCVVLLHQGTCRQLWSLSVGGHYELLLLLLQVVFETLECWIYYLLVLEVVHILSEVLTILLVYFSFLEKLVFVQIWSWTFMFGVLVADSGWRIHRSWGIDRHLLLLDVFDLIGTSLIWKRLCLQNHVNFLFELIDIRYALKSMVILLPVFWSLRMSFTLNICNCILVLWEAVGFVVHAVGLFLSLVINADHGWVYFGCNWLIANYHVACVGSYRRKVIAIIL